MQTLNSIEKKQKCLKEFFLYSINLLQKDHLPMIFSDFPKDEAVELEKFITKIFSLDLKFLLNPNNECIGFSHTVYLFILKLLLKTADEFILNKQNEQEFQKKTEDFLANFFKKDKQGEIIIVVFCVFYTFLALFLKENWLGTSYLFQDAEKKLNRERKIILNTPPKKMFEYNFSEICTYFSINLPYDPQNLNEYTLRKIKSKELIQPKNSDLFCEFMSSEGEIFPSQIKYPQIFYLITILIKQISDNLDNQMYYVKYLWRARVLFLHNKLLDSTPLGGFKKQIFQEYDNFFECLQKEKESLDLKDKTVEKKITLLYVELAYTQLFYYKYKSSENILQQVQDVLGLTLEFTGKLGYKTKYQQFSTAILVLEAQKKENETQASEIQKLIIDENNDIPEVSSFLPAVPQNLNLDQDSDNILHEKPVFLEDSSSNMSKDKKLIEELDTFDQVLVLCKMQHLIKSRAKDEIMKEQISAYLDLFLNKAHNWLSYSQGLYLRSINEFPSYKRRERSLLQMESLVNQFNDKTPDLSTRLSLFWSLNYPNYLDLQKKTAELFMQNGNVLTSCELFRKIEMFEECIECLAVGGIIQQAKELAQTLLKEGKETPKLLCILGDLYQDISYYKRSWKISNKKFARAQRSLGRLYFQKKELEKAIKAYNKALKINYFNPGAWFTLGCIYLSLNRFSDGILAFSTCVQIDESNGEAWANLSACFMRENKKKEALSCIEQGVKFNENSWRMWSNLMILSLELKKFSRFIESVQRLILLEKKEIIDIEVLMKVVQIFSYSFDKYCNNIMEKRSLLFYKEIVEKTLKLCCDKLGEKWEVWQAFCEFLKVLLLYEIKEQEKKEVNFFDCFFHLNTS